jgi:hypothetical protein
MLAKRNVIIRNADIVNSNLELGSSLKVNSGNKDSNPCAFAGIKIISAVRLRK